MNGDQQQQQQQHEHKNKSETSNSPSPNKSSLPSMPKLDVSTVTASASTNPFQSNSLKSSTQLQSTTNTTNNGAKTNGYIKNVAMANGNSTGPHRPLVPYDDDSDTYNQSDDSCNAADKSQRRSMFDDDEDDEASKSPPMIDNPSGSWKVTPATTCLTVSHNSQNGHKRFNNSEDTSRVTTNDTGNITVSKLIKNSHRGYGGTVTAWNGQVSSMDKEVGCYFMYESA